MTEDSRRRARAEAERLVRDLVQERIAKGLTEAEVAARMGVTPDEVARLERETDWLVGDFTRYAWAIGVPVSFDPEEERGAAE